MVHRLFSTAGSLLAVGLLLHAAMATSALAQRAIDGVPTYGPAPHVMQRPSRNLGEVFSGAMKNAGVQTASNEEEIQTRPENIQPGTIAENGSVMSSHGEIYDGEFYGDYCDDCCDYCGPAYLGTWYLRGEYLLWWLSGDRYPALVTTSPQGTPRAEAGVLGEPDTRVLFGDDTFNSGSRNGVRTVLGVYLTDCVRLEGDWFTLGSNGAQFNRSSEGDPILARPFFNLQPTSGLPRQDANLIAYPGAFDGRIDIRANTDFVGAGINLARNLSYCCEGCGYSRLDLVYGFRYLGLYDDFEVNTSSTVEGQSTAPVGTVLDVTDSFTTSNSFFGGNIGVVGEVNRGRWFFTGAARIGIGGTRQRVNIAGSTVVTQPDEDPVTFDGGLLALPTNIGRYSQNSFGLVPHLELKVAYLISPRIRWSVGYDLMYWSRVVRPGEQIDLFINTTQASGGQLQGTPGPLFPFKETDLWITGFSTGVEVQF